MPRELEPIGENAHGDEAHPAFGMISASRVSHSPPGKTLFDSDVSHQHYVVLRIGRATRKRDLHRDWIHGNLNPIVEVAMSEAQWAAMVSSMNTSGVPCTIEHTEKDGQMAGLPPEGRLALTHQQVKGAADKAFQSIRDARDEYEKALADKAPAKVRNQALRNLHFAIENSTSNVTFAAKSLSEHAETVVQKARADVESMVDSRARQLGIDPVLVDRPQLGAAPEDGPELDSN